jgi:hypothetical protein
MSNTASNVINIPRYPPEFQQIITAKNHNFVGRDFVFFEINDFFQQYDRGYFTIIGEPGVGKSAILAHYVCTNLAVVYYNVELPDKNRAEEFFSLTVTQLREILQNLGGQNLSEDFPNATTEASRNFSLLLQIISDRLQPQQRLIITIDGCDRIDLNNQPPGSNIFYLPRYLPEKVYFILTRRPFLPNKSGLLLETPVQSLDLSAYSEQQQSDVQTYINNYLNSHNISQQLLPKIGNKETNFMYVSETLATINDNISSPNLQKYYQNHWQKMILATNKQQMIALSVLKILVQEGSISVDRIAERLEQDEYEIKVILNKWREFLHLESQAGKIYYSLYHFSFRDWLSQQLESDHRL